VQPSGVRFTYTILTTPASNQGVLIDANHQTVLPGARLPNASVTFRPAPVSSAARAFAYQASFGTLRSSGAVIHITVTSTAPTVVGIPVIGTGAIVLAAPINGYFAGATVFFDANGNGCWILRPNLSP